jgi:endonuclease I
MSVHGICRVFFVLLSMAAVNAYTQECAKPGFQYPGDQIYYQPADGFSGAALRSALNTIIKDHQRYDYGCVWTMLAELDVNPEDSSEVIGFYTRRPIAIVDRDRGGNTPNAWNREHIWAKSHGFPGKGQHGYTDIHHLRATDKSVNADRGNLDFAESDNSHWECSGCYWDSNSWEPPDEVKGDTARMMFYMATRYDGNDNSGTPDLVLVDQYTSVDQPRFGLLCDLMQWHVADPVSPSEQQRNELAFQWQGNRNPFIDRPDYAVLIWGDACGIALPEPVVEYPDVDEDIPFLPVWGLLGLFALLWRADRLRKR